MYSLIKADEIAAHVSETISRQVESPMRKAQEIVWVLSPAAKNLNFDLLVTENVPHIFNKP
jgi:hypothetical protein